MTRVAVRLKDVDVEVGAFRLRDVTLEIPEGSIMGLVGPNGAGKTTLIRTLLGMLRARSGTVEVLGSGEPLPSALFEDIGTVLDRPSLVGNWSVGQVERVLSPFYAQWDHAAWRSLIDRFALDPGAKVSGLSRGMGMKLQMALALSHHARLLVLDEPTSGLDPISRDELLGILGDFLVDERHSVLFSTHITTGLERIADSVTMLNGGRLLCTGPTDLIRDSYVLVRGDASDLPDAGIVRLLGPRRTSVGVEALVTGRHAAAIAVWVGASLLALTVAATRSAMNASPPSLSQITLAAAASATGMAMMLVATLPVCYLLGYTRGRFLVFVPMLIAFALVPLATQLGAGSLIATLWPHVMRVFTPAALCGLAIALTALSIVLSTAAATTPRRRQRPTGSRRSATRLL